MKPAMIISTYPDKRSAAKTARMLVGEGAAACVNISKISSIYHWKNHIEESSEHLAIFKTVQGNKRLLKRRIMETHPYDVPEIAEISVSSVNAAYLDWLADPSG